MVKILSSSSIFFGEVEAKGVLLGDNTVVGADDGPGASIDFYTAFL